MAKPQEKSDTLQFRYEVLRQLVGGRVEVETYVNGPKRYVWVFRCAWHEATACM